MMAAEASLTKANYEPSYYSQWERKKPQLPGLRHSCSAKTELTTHSVGRRPISTSCSRASRLRGDKTVIHTTSNREKLLEMRIIACRTAIRSFNLREQELLSSNMVLKQSIETEERPNHESIKGLLRKYEKFRGGIAFLSKNFEETLKAETTALTALRQQLDNELTLVQRTVDELDKELKEKQNQVHVLNNYKDKEYPVKAIQIAELMAELDQEDATNEIELMELEHIVDRELHKILSEGHQAETHVKETALTKVLDKMHPSLKEMSEQNQVMAGEIQYHCQSIEQLETDIESLRKEVKELLIDPKTNTKLQLFPEMFKYQTPCTPDMDVVLDIPTINFLPI